MAVCTNKNNDDHRYNSLHFTLHSLKYCVINNKNAQCPSKPVNTSELLTNLYLSVGLKVQKAYSGTPI